jgi:hypothetical protein
VRLSGIRETVVQIVVSVGDGTEDEGMLRQGRHSVRRCRTDDDNGMVQLCNQEEVSSRSKLSREY